MCVSGEDEVLFEALKIIIEIKVKISDKITPSGISPRAFIFANLWPWN